MNKSGYLIGLFLLICSLSGCKKDDYVYPPVITEILCARTNASGSVSSLVTDRGKLYDALNGNILKGLSKDSVYRVYCVYELSSEVPNGVNLYSFQLILSPDPVKANRFPGGIKTDPLKPVSVWLSGGYINLSLDVNARDLRKHRFHFVDGGTKELFDHKVWELTLYHDQGGDPEDYFQPIYLSVPLRNYDIISGDEISFKINTFEGIRTYTLDY